MLIEYNDQNKTVINELPNTHAINIKPIPVINLIIGY
jgi:hypothetical protein